MTIPATTTILPISNRLDWLQWRRSVLTGSDMAAIAGVDEYRSPLSVYIDKTRGLAIDDNNIMRRGRWLEPAIINALRDERPDWDIRPARVFLRDDERRLGGTPDAFASRPDRPGYGIVEGKVVAQRVFDSTWADGAPLRHQLQALLYAKLAGADWASVVALVIGEFSAEIEIVDVPLSDAAWSRIQREAAAFWLSIERGEQPALRPDLDRELLRAIYPKAGGPPRDLSGNNALPALLEERQALMASIKSANERKDEIETIVMEAMGDAPEGALPGFKILWKEETKPEHVRAAWSGRVLRIYPKKGKSNG